MTRSFPRPEFLLWFALVLLYAPTVSFGFLWEDIYLVTMDFGRAIEQLGTWQFRPLWLLSYPATSLVSTAPWFHHFVNLALFAGVVASYLVVARRFKSDWILAGLAFTHPSFIWSVSWIAQRNDLILLLTLLAALYWVEHKKGLLAVTLSLLAKTPYLFHALYFLGRWARDREWIKFAVLVAVFSLTLGLSYFVASDHLAASNVDQVSTNLFVQLAIRLAKVAEGILYVFVPFPAAYGTVYLVPSVIISVVAWTTLAWIVIRSSSWRMAGWALAALALANVLPLVFNSSLRVVAVIVPFIFLLVGTVLRPSRTLIVIMTVMFLSNLVLVALNYRLSDTDCRVAEFEVSRDSRSDFRWTSHCDPPSIPMLKWNEDRDRVIADIVRGMRAPRAN